MKGKKICAISLSILILSQAIGCGEVTTNTVNSNSSSITSTSENTNIETEVTTSTDKDSSSNVEYNNKLFDTSYVHVIDVTISEEDWTDLKTNPTAKTKYQVNVEIDGETISDVSFATKGNTSLTSVASDENSDRYSFKINFGKYVDGQTYYGLNKLSLNNIYADATYMKDYISYYIFNAVGVDAPLASYVELKINGESFGLYLALEDISESYLDRVDSENSQLYKPETEMLGNMDKVGDAPNGDNDNNMPGGNFQMPEGFDPNNMPSGNFQMPERSESGDSSNSFNPGNPPEGFNSENMPEGFNPGNMPEGFDSNNMTGGFNFGNMFGGSSSGAALTYSDDNIESYSDIFDNTVTNATDEDKQAVITALKNLSEGNITDALDIDEVIKYFVAHNFVLNYDSYTGNMLHNYYLMETDGKLSILPWDYNLSFGAFSGAGMDSNGATSLINCGIDSPLSGASESDRPLWSFITSNEQYLNQYHEVYSSLIEFINSGELEKEMNRVYEMIYSYVENDASAFYSVSEFEKAFETLSNFCKLRAESIEKQLTGELSTITSEQEDAARVDGSAITINDMGSQGQDKKNFSPNMNE